MAWRGAFNDCGSERSRHSQLCQMSTTAGVASFENRQRAADTQLMFSSSVNPAAAQGDGGGGTERFAEGHYTPWSVESEQKQRLAEEISQIHRDITSALHEHVPQEELLRTLLSINEEIARLDNSLRSTGGYDSQSSLAKNAVSIQNLAAEALDQTGAEMLETERNKWLGDFRRALESSSVSSSVRDQLTGLVEQRRRRGQQLETLATKDRWSI